MFHTFISGLSLLLVVSTFPCAFFTFSYKPTNKDTVPGNLPYHITSLTSQYYPNVYSISESRNILSGINCNSLNYNASGIPDTGELKKIDKLYFLIHGFCYAEMSYNKDESEFDASFTRYLAHENKCAARWRSTLHDLDENEALVIIPWKGAENGPATKYNTFASTILGDRCFILDCEDPSDQAFWENTSDEFNESVIKELGSVLIHQKERWNKEELFTSLHTLACSEQLHRLMKERGYFFDKKTVTAESWGASFEGCVTKYTCCMKQYLGLDNVIQINFNLTVPDALFLLGDVNYECIMLNNGIRLFIFKDKEHTFALFMATGFSTETHPLYVKLGIDPEILTVKSKQGIRLWPDPEEYCLPDAPSGFFEPPQILVTYEKDGLHVPVSYGFAYRLAKAPAFIFAGPGITSDEFRDLLLQAEIVK